MDSCDAVHTLYGNLLRERPALDEFHHEARRIVVYPCAEGTYLRKTAARDVDATIYTKATNRLTDSSLSMPAKYHGPVEVHTSLLNFSKHPENHKSEDTRIQVYEGASLVAETLECENIGTMLWLLLER